MKRRDFISLSAIAATTTAAASISSCSNGQAKEKRSPGDELQSMTNDVAPITLQEREARVNKAQRLLSENKLEALILDCGSSLQYFTGISWWPSERPMVAIIPARGDIKYVCPGFEEGRLRELIKIGKDVYAWQEDESPYKQMATALQDAGIQTGNIGMEERLRFFILDGVRKETSHLAYVSGDPVTMPCRIIKSTAELALMQKASDITSAAIKFGITQLREGMTQNELSSIIDDAQRRLGGEPDFSLTLFGESSAFPHGSTKPRTLRKGDIVLMDCGCTVQNYSSDITRTIVFGAEPTKRQLEIWNVEKQAQERRVQCCKDWCSLRRSGCCRKKDNYRCRIWTRI